jgi:hypothetical protein
MRCSGTRWPQHLAVLPAVAVLLAMAACTGRSDTRTDQPASRETANVVELGSALQPVDSERVTATVTVSAARPADGDGLVQVYRRAPLQMPGASAAYAMEGVSGPLQHGFLVVLDSSGDVKVVTHKWSNADNSVVAQTDCGSRQICPVDQVMADRRTGTVTFNGLVLTGLDGNTGDPATSTLTGHVP